MPEEEPTTEQQEAPQPEEAEVSPRKRAKALRKLDDDALLAVAEKADQADHWLDVARRSQAELDNAIKRIRREHQDDVKYAAASLVRELLPVLDNLARALHAGMSDLPTLRQGIELTHKQFVEALARMGVTPIEAEGLPFDPAFHEALMTANVPETEDNHITMELEKGWKLHDRVLRASKVQVNKKA